MVRVHQGPTFLYPDFLYIIQSILYDPGDSSQLGFLMADRPLECSECSKALCYYYTYVDLEREQSYEMCASCPLLAKKIFQEEDSISSTAASPLKVGLSCAHCGTSLEAVRLGSPLGCEECYEVFADLLFKEVVASDVIDERTILHVGRTPGESSKINPGMRLLSLNEALTETLNREDYEQAAWLRDQIKKLKEGDHHGKGH